MMATEVAGVTIERGHLAELFLRHGPDAVRLAYLLTGDRALAEDLVQEAFAKLVGRLLHLRKPDAFPAYLRKMVVNQSKMHFRRQHLERAYLEQLGVEASDEASGPEVDQREDLWRALLALPTRQRAALVLRYYEDLSEQQIAETLRCRPGTVRSLLSRGVQTLRAGAESRGDLT